MKPSSWRNVAKAPGFLARYRWRDLSEGKTRMPGMSAVKQSARYMAFSLAFISLSTELNSQELDVNELARLETVRSILNERADSQGYPENYHGNLGHHVLYERSVCMALGYLIDQQQFTHFLNQELLEAVDQALRSGSGERAREAVYRIDGLTYQIERFTPGQLEDDRPARTTWDLECAGREITVSNGPDLINDQGTARIPSSAQVVKDPRNEFYTYNARSNEILILGDVTEGFSSRLLQALRTHPDAQSIGLGSSGGNVGEAIRAARIIRQRNLDTTIQSACDSACPLVFFGWREPPCCCIQGSPFPRAFDSQRHTD